MGLVDVVKGYGVCEPPPLRGKTPAEDEVVVVDKDEEDEDGDED
jgi:hypothetical protein